MRDYVLSQAQSLGEFDGGAYLSRLYRNWKARRSVSRLAEYDEYMLRDIGITREEIRWASNLPLSVNAALALEDRAFRRRKLGRQY